MICFLFFFMFRTPYYFMCDFCGEDRVLHIEGDGEDVLLFLPLLLHQDSNGQEMSNDCKQRSCLVITKLLEVIMMMVVWPNWYVMAEL